MGRDEKKGRTNHANGFHFLYWPSPVWMQDRCSEWASMERALSWMISRWNGIMKMDAFLSPAWRNNSMDLWPSLPSLGKSSRSKARLLASCWLLFASSASYADDPELFGSRHFNAAFIAEAVNHYVLIGEQRTKAELEALSPLAAYGPISYSRTLTNLEAAERVSWMCLILWPGKSQLPPLYGGLWDLQGRFDDQQQWPLYPVVQAGSSYFVLSTDYFIAGLAEPPRDYLHRCEARGPFRSETVPVPSRLQAERDLLQLRNSPPWIATWTG